MGWKRTEEGEDLKGKRKKKKTKREKTRRQTSGYLVFFLKWSCGYLFDLCSHAAARYSLLNGNCVAAVSPLIVQLEKKKKKILPQALNSFDSKFSFFAVNGNRIRVEHCYIPKVKTSPHAM